MNLRQIRSFVAVYEEGSFSKAALRENCTQPGLSLQIQHLELALKQPLFERLARGVEPTNAGRIFYRSCQSVIDALREARQNMSDLSGSFTGSISIGVPPSFSKHAVPPALKKFIEAHPFASIRLAEAYSGSLAKWVSDNDLDFAIVTEPPSELGLEVTAFFKDRLMLVCAPGTPLPAKAKEKPEPLKLVAPSTRHSLRRQIETLIHHGIERTDKVLEVDGLVATIELVRNSDWVTILPSIAIAYEVAAGTLQAAPLRRPDTWLEYYLIHKRETPRSAAASDFFRLLLAELEAASGLSGQIAPSHRGQTALSTPSKS
jgi:LysR family transcriptional regulator, nitrogen assimilation regulatory protein